MKVYMDPTRIIASTRKMGKDWEPEEWEPKDKEIVWAAYIKGEDIIKAAKKVRLVRKTAREGEIYILIGHGDAIIAHDGNAEWHIDVRGGIVGKAKAMYCVGPMVLHDILPVLQKATRIGIIPQYGTRFGVLVLEEPDGTRTYVAPYVPTSPSLMRLEDLPKQIIQIWKKWVGVTGWVL